MRSYSQESIRMSVAGEQAAAAQKATTSSNYYNIQAGPVYFRFQGEMGFLATDNANYSSTAPDADIGLCPTLNIRAFWPVTQRNTLALSVGIGYVEYLHEPSLSYLNISSDSGLAFKVYSGDFVFDVHDRFSATDYQVEDPSVSAELIRFENTAGLGVTWDLNKLLLSAGYDHDTYTSLTKSYDYSDNASELFNGKAAFILSPSSQVGLEAGGGTTAYTQHVLDNSTHFSVGPFYQSQFTSHLSAKLAAGYASYQFAHDGTVLGVSDFSGYYASATLTHRLNNSFSHSLAAGRQIQLGVTTELSEDYFVTYQATWNFLRDVFVTFSASYDHGNTTGGEIETYNRYGPGITMGWRMTEKLLTRLSYTYYDLRSDVSTLSYTQNRVLLDFTYDF